MQIETADSGDACLALFKRNFYDVIFLDHMMPDKDGIETIKEMKECKDTPNEKTPVICLTANAVSGMREMYINAGFDDYLTKPIDTGRLESMLLRYLPPDLVEQVDQEESEDKKKKENKPDILVASKDVAILKNVKEWLSEIANVVVVKSVDQANTYLEKHETELIIASDNMPEINGCDNAKLIRCNLRDISRDDIISQVNEFFGKSN